MMKKRIYYYSLGLGVLSLTLQIVLLREVLQLFLGNELVLGLSLAVWLMGTGLGALLVPGKLSTISGKHSFMLLIFPVPILSYFFIKLSPEIFNLIPGIPQDPFSTLTIIILAIFPSATICGFLFPYLVETVFRTQRNSISSNVRSVYILESLGAMLAAILMNFFLFHYLSNFQILLLSLMLFAIIIILTDRSKTFSFFPKFFFYLSFLLILILLIFHEPVLNRIHRLVFYPYQVLQSKDTPYGNHKLLQLEDQKLLLRQGIIAYSQPDVYSAEISLMLPLVLNPEAKSILIVGGDLYGFVKSTSQMLSGKEIVYLEEDPFLLSYQKGLFEEDLNTGEFVICFIHGDIRSYLNALNSTYDIICLNKPEPYTLADNRYYARKFYRLVAERLEPSGIFTFSVRASENFINPALAKYLNLLHNTMSTNFRHISIIPGDDAVFLASNQRSFETLRENWTQKIQILEVSPRYLIGPYIVYRLSDERVRAFEQRLEQYDNHSINEDFNIKGYTHHYQVWGGISDPIFNRVFWFLSNYSFSIAPIILLFFVVGILVARRSLSDLSLFNLGVVGGYSIALEIIFLLQYQILYGSIYTGLTIIFGLFMLGLAGGAEFINRVKGLVESAWINRLLLTGFIFLALLLLITEHISGRLAESPVFKWGIGPIYVLLLGIITGGYFAYATHAYYKHSPISASGTTYGVDILGGMTASLLVSLFLIPIMEISGVLLLLAGKTCKAFVYEHCQLKRKLQF